MINAGNNGDLYLQRDRTARMSAYDPADDGVQRASVASGWCGGGVRKTARRGDFPATYVATCPVRGRRRWEIFKALTIPGTRPALVHETAERGNSGDSIILLYRVSLRLDWKTSPAGLKNAADGLRWSECRRASKTHLCNGRRPLIVEVPGCRRGSVYVFRYDFDCYLSIYTPETDRCGAANPIEFSFLT